MLYNIHMREDMSNNNLDLFTGTANPELSF
jgi:hypothetical protein